jgi:pullulanase/glycogen debranching enzyme
LTETQSWFERDPLWFKTAVFYEIHLRAFFDGNDDGSGDFRGLSEKLDYLQWLGVDCVWLLPFYPTGSTPTTAPSTTSGTSSTRRTSAASA